MKIFKVFCVAFYALLFCCPIWAMEQKPSPSEPEVDQEAVQFEAYKKLLPIPYEKIRDEFLAIQDAIDREEHLTRASQGAPLMGGWVGFIDDGDIESPSERERRHREETADYQATLKIEKGILKSLREFASNHPVFSKELKILVKKWRKSHLDLSVRDSWPSDLAETLAQFLIQKQDDCGAQKLLDLSILSPMQSGDSQYLASGLMLMNYYNQEVCSSGGSGPTASLFSAVRKSRSYFLKAAGGFEYAQDVAQSLKKVQDMMVRWPISPRGLQLDTYYPQLELLKKVYSRGFVDRLLKDLDGLQSIFKAYKCQGGLKEGDLAGSLYQAGFYGVKKYYDSKPQYLWVNPKGYLVRAKFNSNRNRWESTVGLTFENPLKWADEQAIATRRGSDLSSNQNSDYSAAIRPGQELIECQYNEIFKIAVEEDGLVTVMPAFRIASYWFNPSIHMDSYLSLSHREIKTVGSKSKNGTDFSKIDQLCGF